MLQLISAPQVLVAPTQSHRFMVELASIETVLDCAGVPVPAYIKKVDVLVAEPCLDAITTVLTTDGYLEGFEIMSHWIHTDCHCF